MSDKRPEEKFNRRGFLTAGAGAATAAAATVVAPITQAVAAENDTERKKARYQANAQNVQAFYRVNRYQN